MKISASYWMFEGGIEAKRPVAEAMQDAKDLGFEAIELCIASSGVLTHETTKAECEDMVAAAEKIGIEIASVASGESWFSSPSANDPDTRRKIIDFTHNALQITNWLGTDAYLFVPGAVDVDFMPEAEVIPYDICYERATQAVSELVPTAEQCGVVIGIENVGNAFLLSPLEMRDFIDSFKSEFVGAYFDFGNVLMIGYPDHWIRILGKRIKRLHAKNYEPSLGIHDGFNDLSVGALDFDALKKALAEIAYDGYVTAELIPFAPGRPGKTAETMKRIFK